MYSSSSRFWKVTAGLPLATVALSSSAQTNGFPVGLRQHQDTETWTFHHDYVLGTSIDIRAGATNEQEAGRAEAAVLEAFDRDEAVLSTWRDDSEVSQWARTRFAPVAVSAELFEVLAAFDHWRARTNGALDPAVEAATRLWRTATAEGRVPSHTERTIAAKAMQQPHWLLDRENRTATRLSDVPLALASFTKSYISSRAADAALQAGATGVMLNVGGDVIVRGDMNQMIAIANPQAATENDAALDYVVVRDRAVATSGSYRRGFTLNTAMRRPVPDYSHLIDPRTAQPMSHVISSTVIARDAVTAGALATAFSILPVDESRSLAASVPGLEYLLVLAGGEQISSNNWPQSPGFRAVAFQRSSSPHSATRANGLWNPAFELTVDVEVPRIDDFRYHRPYLAVWVEDADHSSVRTLALWGQKPRYIPELRQWYRDNQERGRSDGMDISRTISSATRPPGRYTLKWDGTDDEGKPVKAGKYTICIEASREHGGYDIQHRELTFGNQPQQATVPASGELGAVTIDYHNR